MLATSDALNKGLSKDFLASRSCSDSRSFEDTRRKAIRALRETEIKGVKTNIAFMLNVLNHPTFAAGDCDTGFIANTPDLLDIAKVEDNELRVSFLVSHAFTLLSTSFSFHKHTCFSHQGLTTCCEFSSYPYDKLSLCKLQGKV